MDLIISKWSIIKQRIARSWDPIRETRIKHARNLSRTMVSGNGAKQYTRSRLIDHLAGLDMFHASSIQSFTIEFPWISDCWLLDPCGAVPACLRPSTLYNTTGVHVDVEGPEPLSRHFVFDAKDGRPWNGGNNHNSFLHESVTICMPSADVLSVVKIQKHY